MGTARPHRPHEPQAPPRSRPWPRLGQPAGGAATPIPEPGARPPNRLPTRPPARASSRSLYRCQSRPANAAAGLRFLGRASTLAWAKNFAHGNILDDGAKEASVFCGALLHRVSSLWTASAARVLFASPFRIRVAFVCDPFAVDEMGSAPRRAKM